MTAHSLINRYKQESILNAPPEKLIPMLYDCAIQKLQQAAGCIDQSSHALFGQPLSRAQAIVAELLGSLDHEVGGKISRDLESLYLFIIERLIDSNINKQGKGIQESIDILTTLKEGWVYAASNESRQQAATTVDVRS